MRYELAQLSGILGLPERYYLTREKGEVAYDHLLGVLDEVPPNEPLVLVLPPDQIVDASFADEAIVRLYEHMMATRDEDRTLLLMGLTDDSLKNINAVIQLRNIKLAMLAVNDDGHWEVVGQLEKSLRDTLDMLAERERLTAPELADSIGSAVNTASNRLKRLFDGRLIRREHEVSEKGLQYIYYFWRWDH